MPENLTSTERISVDPTTLVTIGSFQQNPKRAGLATALASAIRAGLEAGSTVGAVMSTQLTAQIEATGLMAEVRRYLIAVDAFRAEGREPRWRPEREVGPRLEASSSLVLSTDRRRYT